MKILFVLLIIITIKSEMLLASQDDQLIDDDSDFAGGVFPTTDSNSDVQLKLILNNNINIYIQRKQQLIIKHFNIYNNTMLRVVNDLQWEECCIISLQLQRERREKKNMRFKLGFKQIKSRLLKQLNVNNYEQQYFFD